MLLWQARQRTTFGRSWKRYGSPDHPHSGQTKPAGHRTASRYSMQVASSWKRAANAGKDCGRSSGTTGLTRPCYGRCRPPARHALS